MNPAFAPYIEAVETEMRAVVCSSAADLSGLYGMMLYHLGWLDAQLRPETLYLLESENSLALLRLRT